MSRRRKSLVGIGTVAALALGGLAATPSVATAGSDDPVFRPVPATSLPEGGGSTTDSATAARSSSEALARAAATVKVSKAEQLLQVFDGRQSQDAGAAPDVAVAAGPRHVVQLTNTGSLGLVKATGKPVAALANNLKGFFGIGGSTSLRQPQIGYDPVGKRWVASALTDTGGDVGVALRVSKGTKPTNWFRAVAYLDSGSDEAGREDVVESLPRLGIAGDKVVLTMAADDPNDAVVANRIFVVNKSQLYRGGQPEAWVADVNSSYDGSVPAVNASKGANAFVAVPDNDGAIDDFTVYTLSGAATDNPPNFSKSVMFPSWTLTPPPTIPASAAGGDPLAVSDSLSSAAWRKGNLWVATTVTCTPSGDTGPRACLRMIRVNTKNGVFLAESRLSSRIGIDWFAPAIAIDGNNAPHVGFTYANAGASGTGPGFAVMVRKAQGKWPFKVVTKPQEPIVGPGSPTAWSRFAGAASDPTSPWDVWVSGAFGSSTALNPNWGTSIARVSRGINTASVKPNKKRVSKGTRVTFKGSLLRPASSNAVQGLPVTLQARPAGTKKWRNVGSGTVNAQGVKSWKLRVSKTTQYRLIGKAVSQTGGEGQLVARAVGNPVRVRVG